MVENRHLYTSLRSGLPEIVKNISFIFFASVEQATKEFVNKL